MKDKRDDLIKEFQEKTSKILTEKLRLINGHVSRICLQFANEIMKLDLNFSKEMKLYWEEQNEK